ncbi:hypothetical protein ACIB24_13280 [Spongisporangium articulatum]|uniref:Transposase n=1 Tax=Spongisporangium articulatum TaxID=3362603 RepID=A0ABW8AQ37_9ACTN
MDLAEAVRELYAGGQADFVARRDALAKAAKADGDAALAATVKKLRKPSAGAWLANMLARHRQSDLEELLALGAAMRAAQEELDGARLRTLSGERSAVVASVLGVARSLADQLDQPAGDAALGELDQTLRAALTDPATAAAAVSGQLLRGLTSDGLGPPDLTGAVADPDSVPEAPVVPPRRFKAVPDEPGARPAPAPKPKADTAARDARRAAAAEKVRAAGALVESLDSDLAGARAELADVTQRYEELAAELAQLRDRAAQTEHALVRAKRDLRAAERDERLTR